MNLSLFEEKIKKSNIKIIKYDLLLAGHDTGEMRFNISCKYLGNVKENIL